MFDAIAKSIQINFIEKNRYTLVLRGLKITIVLTLASFLGAILLGALLCAGMASKKKWLSKIINIYNSIINKVPPLVLLMLFSYVIFKGVRIQSEMIAFIGITIRMASTMADIFYSGIKSVKPGEIDAARTLGMSPSQAFFHVMLPQASRNIAPLFKSQFVMCLQMTSVVSMLGVMDMTRAVNIIATQTFDPYLSVIFSTVVYMAIGFIGDLVIGRFTREHHLKIREVE